MTLLELTITTSFSKNLVISLFKQFQPLSNSDGSAIYVVLPKMIGNKGTFNHIAKIDLAVNN